MVEINGLKLEHQTKLFIDEDGQGRLLIPKLMLQALRLTKGDGIKLKCELNGSEICIKKRCGSG